MDQLYSKDTQLQDHLFIIEGGGLAQYPHFIGCRRHAPNILHMADIRVYLTAAFDYKVSLESQIVPSRC